MIVVIDSYSKKDRDEMRVRLEKEYKKRTDVLIEDLVEKECIQRIKANYAEVDRLIEKGTVEVAEDGHITYHTKLKDDSITPYTFRQFALRGRVYQGIVYDYYCGEHTGYYNIMNLSYFEKYKDVYLFVCGFEISAYKPFFDANGIKYELKTIKDGKLVDYEFYLPHIDRLHICTDTSLEELSSYYFDFTKKGYEKVSNVGKLKRNLQKHLKTYNPKSKYTAWITYDYYIDKIAKIRGLTNNYVYGDGLIENLSVNHILYLVNVEGNKYLHDFFSRTYKMDDVWFNDYNVHHALRFIYGSAICHGDDVVVYVASNTVRNKLLKIQKERMEKFPK